VREGVHRVDAPLVAGVVVLGMAHAVDGRVAQIDVGRGHVDLGAQHGGAIGQLAVASSRRKRARFSATVRSRKGLFTPGG
jgi:hypothetical protein